VNVEKILRLLVRFALAKHEQLLGEITRGIGNLDIEADAAERKPVLIRESDCPRLGDHDVEVAEFLRGYSLDSGGRVTASIASVIAR